MRSMKKTDKRSKNKKAEKETPIWQKVTVGGSMFGNKQQTNYGEKMKVKPNKVFRGVR
jgi:hypothetical protein